MGKKITVTVKNLHITYRGLKKTSIRSSWKNMGHKVELFKALKGVSFEIEEGKILGIIGNIILLIIKIGAALISNSQSMLADAFNSAGDIFSSFFGGE